jgi:hypothetical protein
MNKKTGLPAEVGKLAEERKTLFPQIRHSKKRAMLWAYAELGHVRKASQKVKIDRSTHYKWLQNDPAYAQAFEQAKKIIGDEILGDVIDAVLNGDRKPIIFEGKVTGHYTQKSDLLRMFLSKGFHPEFRDNWVVGSMQGPVSVNFTFAPSDYAYRSPAKPLASDDAEVIGEDNGAGNGEAKS